MVLVVAVLYFAQELFLPFALAALVTFLLAPVAAGLQRWHLPRMLAVLTTVLLALGLVIGLLVLLVAQLDELSSSLPQYRDTIREKLSAVGGTVADIEKGLKDAMPEVAGAEPSAGAPDATGKSLIETFRFGSKDADPIAVTVVPNKPGAFELVSTIVGPVLAPLGSIAVVAVLVLFMLMYMEDLRDRVVRVISRGGVTVTTQAMSDVTDRISRYLLMTLVVNTTYGIPVGIGLLLLGVPNALLWGLLAIVLRFIPYLGPWLAAAFPIALSFAISPGWALPLAVMGMFLALELISNNIVEPWLYGSRTGLSPVAIVAAAVFWTWLWGTAGLLLAVPLTLIVVVTGRYVPSLRFLHTLLGDEPGLTPETRFYQRLVAAHSDEAERELAQFLERRPLTDLYDELVLPALRSAKQDEAEGLLTPEAALAVREMVGEIIIGLPALSDKKSAARAKLARAEAKLAEPPNGLARILAGLSTVAEADKPGDTRPDAPFVRHAVRVVFLPAGDDNSALVGPLLADLLKAHGIDLHLLSPKTLSSDLLQSVADAEPDVVVIAGLPPVPFVRMRGLIAKSRTIASGMLSKLGVATPEVRIIAGLWDAPVSQLGGGAAQPARRLLGFGHSSPRPTLLREVSPRTDDSARDAEAAATFIEAGAHQVTHTLADTVEAVERAVQHLQMRMVA